MFVEISVVLIVRGEVWICPPMLCTFPKLLRLFVGTLFIFYLELPVLVHFLRLIEFYEGKIVGSGFGHSVEWDEGIRVR